METDLQGIVSDKDRRYLRLIEVVQALQLLEFLIKNGSERVIDDARSHLSLLKMLRQFHYIDQNGKDQGINVRNRSKELADLLSDVERIRAERKKARSNRNKFGGVEGGAMGAGISGGSRYGGFGSEEASYGGYSGGVYGDGGGFGGRESGFQDSSNRRDRFEEYDEGDEDGSSTSARRQGEISSSSSKRETKKAEPPRPKEPEVDFLSFDDDVPPETPPKELPSNGKKIAPGSFDNGLGSFQASNTDDDDFDDFQTATPSTTSSSKPSIPRLPLPSTSSIATTTPMVPSQSATLNNLAGFSSISPAPSTATSQMASPLGPNYNINLSSPPPQPTSFNSLPSQVQRPQQPKPTTYQAAAPNYFTSVPAPQSQTPQPSSSVSGNNSRPLFSSTPSFTTTTNNTTTVKPSTGGADAFGNLWSTASSSAGIKKTSTAGGAQGPNLASLQREKATQGLWGAAAAPAAGVGQQPMGMGIGGSNGMKSGGSGLDDLLG